MLAVIPGADAQAMIQALTVSHPRLVSVSSVYQLGNSEHR